MHQETLFVSSGTAVPKKPSSASLRYLAASMDSFDIGQSCPGLAVAGIDLRPRLLAPVCCSVCGARLCLLPLSAQINFTETGALMRSCVPPPHQLWLVYTDSECGARMQSLACSPLFCPVSCRASVARRTSTETVGQCEERKTKGPPHIRHVAKSFSAHVE